MGESHVVNTLLSNGLVELLMKVIMRSIRI